MMLLLTYILWIALGYVLVFVPVQVEINSLELLMVLFLPAAWVSAGILLLLKSLGYV